MRLFFSVFIVQFLLAFSVSASQKGSLVVSDLTLDTLFVTQDLNNDGDAADEGETKIYFDESNSSSLVTPTRSVFSVHRGIDGYVYVADGGSDTVYRLDDKNNDGDANDEGEANIWFSEENVAGLTLPTPNGLHQADDGSIYIVNPGVRSRPQDAVYRTIDLNGDGDANDEGEAGVWLDLSVTLSDVLGYDENVSSAFEITMIDDVAYIVDTIGSQPDAVLRAEDVNEDGVISADELTVFIDNENPYGVPVCIGIVTDGTSLFIQECSTRAELQTIYRLDDLNGNGVIDSQDEATKVWDESVIPEEYPLGLTWGLGITYTGELYLTSAFASENDNVWRLVDLNQNDSFMDPGETIRWTGETINGQFPDFARTVEFLPKYFSLDRYYAVSDVFDYSARLSDITAIIGLLSTNPVDWNLIAAVFNDGQTESSIPALAELIAAFNPHHQKGVNLADYINAAIAGNAYFSQLDDSARADAVVNGLLALQHKLFAKKLKKAKIAALYHNDFNCETGAAHQWDTAAVIYYGSHLQNGLYQQAGEIKPNQQHRGGRLLKKGLSKLAPSYKDPIDQCNESGKKQRFPKRQYYNLIKLEKKIAKKVAYDSLKQMRRALIDNDVELARIAQLNAYANIRAVMPYSYARGFYYERLLKRWLLDRQPSFNAYYIVNFIVNRL